MNDDDRPGQLGIYTSALRRHWLLAVSIVVVAALAGLVFASLTPRSYEATSKVLLDQQKRVDSLLGADNFTPDPERELNTDVQLITLEPVAAAVRRQLSLDESPEALVAKVTTE